MQTAPELLQQFARGYEADPLYRGAQPPSAATFDFSRGTTDQSAVSSRIGSPDGQPLGQLSNRYLRQGQLWYLEVGGLYRICVPSDPQLRQLVLREAHDAPVGAHFGIDKTTWRLGQTFTWSGMTGDVKDYVRTCDQCQRNKPPGGKTRGTPATSTCTNRPLGGG